MAGHCSREFLQWPNWLNGIEEEPPRGGSGYGRSLATKPFGATVPSRALSDCGLLSNSAA